MVDPDNRRPVDWRRRRQLLTEIEARFGNGEADRQAFAELAAHWRDGREKLFLIWRTLALRAARPALFGGADYVPLETSGMHAGRLLAFARKRDGDWLVTVAPRLALPLVNDAGIIDWGDTAVALPEARWRDALANRELGARAGPVAMAELLAGFPVALLASA
jgi:(1->4)-alpha-D-glucan 1-alpha-D-glucosylmutase